MRRHQSELLSSTPKVLLPIQVGKDHYSLLGYALSECRQLQPADLLVLASQLPSRGAEGVAAEIASLSEPNVRIIWDSTDSPTGTASAVYRSLASVRTETLLVLPADTILSYEKLPGVVEHHSLVDAHMTLAVTSRAGTHAQNLDKIVYARTDGRVAASLESTSFPHHLSNRSDRDDLCNGTSCGALVIDVESYLARFRQRYNDRTSWDCLDLYRDYLTASVEEGMRVFAKDIESEVADLGTPDRYLSYIASSRSSSC